MNRHERFKAKLAGTPRIIARRGSAYLVKVSKTNGRILDTEMGILSPEQPLGAIVKTGYWEEDADQRPLERWTKNPKELI